MSSNHSGPKDEKEKPGVHPATQAGRWPLLFGLLLLGALSAVAQSQQDGQAQEQRRAEGQTQTLTGVVTDPSGALVVGASVTLMPVGPGSVAVAESITQSGSAGEYRLRATPGSYTVVAQATGFAKFESSPIRLGGEPGQAGLRLRTLDIRLKLEVEVQQIDVPDEMGDAANRGGSAIILSGRDIETMPLDSAALLDELQGLAGGKDAELFVDGFSGTKLPPRANIREVRINQNPYSAQNDTNPVNGVIQVTTKPGTDQMHGQFYLYGNDSGLNAANPFAPEQPGYYAYASGAYLSGPINRRTSYIFGVDQASNQTNSVIDAQVLDANLNQTGFSQALRSPLSTITATPRIDLQAGPHSTATLRYIFARNEQTNGGIGQLALASQGFDNTILSHTVQATNTQVISPKMVNDTRFQYIRTRTGQTPESFAPALLVEGAFTGGGNDQGEFSDHQDRYELQNYLSLAEGTHYLNVGGRLRVGRDANRSMANYNGEFIFATLSAYQTTLQGIAAGASMAQIVLAGGGASEFNLNAGIPDAAVTIADAGVFAQDDWKVKRNLTLSFGLRFETQSYIADHADWAPRAGFSWGLDAKNKNAAPKYVLHGGAGIFYRRFTTDSALEVERQNGTTQQEYVVTSPNFYSTTTPSVSTLGAQTAPAIYRVSPNFHAPYFVGASIALDRQLGRYGTASLTYMHNRGVHTQLTENINAPEPGTYNPADPTSGTRPLGGSQNIYEYVSEGVYRSSRLSANVTVRAGSHFNAYGYYMLRYDKSDAESTGGFPSNQYDLGADYNRSLDDVRHTATVGGNADLTHGVHASGYLRALSGTPFNIVVGQDLNGDTQYNDRPAFATDLTRPSVVDTRWGDFDTSPIAGQTIIPRNYGQGPDFFLVNLAVGKSFGVGPQIKTAVAAKGPVARKYTLDLWAESQNLLNHPNLTAPVGTLNSPLFGKSLAVTGASALSADRLVDLQISLRF
jgi:Carboxypeptidase regulatory-like domain